MLQHRYRVGDRVYLIHNPGNPSSKIYLVEELLLIENGDVPYRVKNIATGDEQVVLQGQLAPLKG